MSGMPSSYDAWRLSGPPDEETEEEEQAREEAEARAENRAENVYMEDHFERKYGQ